MLLAIIRLTSNPTVVFILPPFSSFNIQSSISRHLIRYQSSGRKSCLNNPLFFRRSLDFSVYWSRSLNIIRKWNEGTNAEVRGKNPCWWITLDRWTEILHELILSVTGSLSNIRTTTGLPPKAECSGISVFFNPHALTAHLRPSNEW